MLQSLMQVALRQRVIVLGAAFLLLVAGIYSFHELDIEAYPDPVQPRVEVITRCGGYPRGSAGARRVPERGRRQQRQARAARMPAAGGSGGH